MVHHPFPMFRAQSINTQMYAHRHDLSSTFLEFPKMDILQEFSQMLLAWKKKNVIQLQIHLQATIYKNYLPKNKRNSLIWTVKKVTRVLDKYPLKLWIIIHDDQNFLHSINNTTIDLGHIPRRYSPNKKNTHRNTHLSNVAGHGATPPVVAWRDGWRPCSPCAVLLPVRDRGRGCPLTIMLIPPISFNRRRSDAQRVRTNWSVALAAVEATAAANK